MVAKDTKKFRYAKKPAKFTKSTGVRVGDIKISVGDARKILTHYNAKMEIQGRIWLMRGNELEKELKNFTYKKSGAKYIFKHRSNRRYTSPAYHLRGMTDAKETKGYEKEAIKQAKVLDKADKAAKKAAAKKKKQKKQTKKDKKDESKGMTGQKAGTKSKTKVNFPKSKKKKKTLKEAKADAMMKDRKTFQHNKKKYKLNKQQSGYTLVKSKTKK